MSLPTFQQFEVDALAKGFDEVAPRVWDADQAVDLHTHPFSVEALVVQGEMWLKVGDDTRHLSAGDPSFATRTRFACQAAASS